MAIQYGTLAGLPVPEGHKEITLVIDENQAKDILLGLALMACTFNTEDDEEMERTFDQTGAWIAAPMERSFGWDRGEYQRTKEELKSCGE